MKKLFKRFFIIGLLLIIFIILNPKIAFAGTQELDNLDFNVIVKENGDMEIKEIWDITIEDTNTLFKTFPIDETYNEIRDVLVTEITDSGERINFTKSNEYQYHVDEGHYQALLNEYNDFEIAWGVNELGYDTRKFEIVYTVTNHISIYNDCAELYWKFVGDEFGINSERVTGTINLPSGITNIEDLRVWAHGPLNGTINRDSVNKVTFSAQNLPSETFLEIRLVMPKSIFELSSKIIDEARLDEILSEEKVWAEEANRERERIAETQKTTEIIINVVMIIIAVFVVRGIIKNNKKLKETPKMKPEQELEYFRDFPDETASAGEAGYLYYFNTGLGTTAIGRIISGTILNLALKGYLSFEQGEKKNEIYIILNNESNKELTKDENEILEYLKSVSGNGEKFSMKQFKKYSESHTSKMQKLMQNIQKSTEKINEDKRKISQEDKSKHSNYIDFNVLYGILIFLLFPLGIGFGNIGITLLVELLIIINMIIIGRLASRITGLTQKGIDEQEKWKALRKYMEDFSMLDEREVPELVLWEKYLVFATVFDVADKVIKQLKVKFPELQDEDYIRSHYTFMHMACNPHNNFNFINSMTSSIGSATNYSSSSGSGGGFSGGGGGGRRWRWRRWPLITKKDKKRL